MAAGGETGTGHSTASLLLAATGCGLAGAALGWHLAKRHYEAGRLNGRGINPKLYYGLRLSSPGGGGIDSADSTPGVAGRVGPAPCVCGSGGLGVGGYVVAWAASRVPAGRAWCAALQWPGCMVVHS